MKVSTENDVKVVYDYFTVVGVIVTADTPLVVTDNTFWMEVVPSTRNTGSTKHHAQEKVAMTKNERFALEVFIDKPTIEYTSNDFDDILDDNLSAVVNA